MSIGTMGKALHPKIVTRIRELLRKDDLTIPMIAERMGVSASQVRNIKHGRDSSHYDKRKRHPMQDEFNSLFDSDEPEMILECPPEPEPKPQPQPVTKPKAVVDPFDDATPALPKPKAMTPEVERLVIVDLRADIAPNIIARRHGVTILDVESLNERVYWLAYPADPNIVRQFTLTHKEHMQALGPKLTIAQLEILKPLMAGANEWISEVFNIDLATADTVRKVVCAYYVEHDQDAQPKPKPPKPKPPKSPDSVATNVEAEIKAIVSTLFSEIEAIDSDELEPLNSLCLRFFHREPEPHTVAAWVAGDNDRKLKLETFEVDGQIMTTEKHFREYFRCFHR